MSEEYKQYEQNKQINLDNIEIGVGLNKVDNLTPSKYFYKALETSKNYKELEAKIEKYYSVRNAGHKECDIVSKEIAELLDTEGFSLSPANLKSIHKKLFTKAFEHPQYVGVFRDVNIEKKEEILGGKFSVIYGACDDIDELLAYDFNCEKQKNYAKLNKQEKVLNIAKFISNIWQIHPFRDGNTRTIAAFAIKYLKSKGVQANNNIFKEHSIYFRNALVLANYENLALNISPDFSYLESFFVKFMIDKNANLKAMLKNIIL